MNSLKSLVETKSEVLGLTRGQLLRKLGYKNLSKAGRRLDSLLASGVGSPDLFAALALALEESPVSLEASALAVRIDLVAEAESHARVSFRPYCQAHLDATPNSPWIFAFCSALTRFGVPLGVQELGFDRELEEVGEMCVEHLRNWGWRVRKLGREIVGYTYCRSHGESIPLSTEGVCGETSVTLKGKVVPL